MLLLSIRALIEVCESMTMLFHPFLESMAWLLQQIGGYIEVHFVPCLLNTTHGFPMLLLCSAVLVCGAELCLECAEVGCGEMKAGGFGSVSE